MENTIVFLDAGFLSKISKHFGKGKYLEYDIIKFAKNLAKKLSFYCVRIFYATAPLFQGTPPTRDEQKKKIKYDKFISKLKENPLIRIEEGRVQKIRDNENIKYSQKGVDALLIMRLSFVPIDFPNVKRIILVSNDTDFCPVIDELKSKGIEIILYSYHERKRDADFSRSTHLLRCCSKYIKLPKQDFENGPLNKSEDKNAQKNI